MEKFIFLLMLVGMNSANAQEIGPLQCNLQVDGRTAESQTKEGNSNCVRFIESKSKVGGEICFLPNFQTVVHAYVEKGPFIGSDRIVTNNVGVRSPVSPYSSQSFIGMRWNGMRVSLGCSGSLKKHIGGMKGRQIP